MRAKGGFARLGEYSKGRFALAASTEGGRDRSLQQRGHKGKKVIYGCRGEKKGGKTCNKTPLRTLTTKKDSDRKLRPEKASIPHQNSCRGQDTQRRPFAGQNERVDKKSRAGSNREDISVGMKKEEGGRQHFVQIKKPGEEEKSFQKVADNKPPGRRKRVGPGTGRREEGGERSLRSCKSISLVRYVDKDSETCLYRGGRTGRQRGKVEGKNPRQKGGKKGVMEGRNNGQKCDSDLIPGISRGFPRRQQKNVRCRRRGLFRGQ